MMDRRMHVRASLLSLSLIAGLLAALACGPALPFLGGNVTPTPDSGTGLEKLGEYAATFDAKFVPDNQNIRTWTYNLNIVETKQGAHRTLVIDGVDRGQDPGDTTLISVGDSQYMIGEGVGSTNCLIFPKDVDVTSSFLLPGSFVPLNDLKAIWKSDGDEDVAGKSGTHYTFEAVRLGSNFTEVLGDAVVSGDIVYRYDFSGHTIDQYFTGQGGTLTWHYEITSFAPEEQVAAPKGCTPPYPIMDNAAGLTRLPGLIQYTSSTPEKDVVLFYDTQLIAEGWAVNKDPEIDENNRVTILNYIREGEVLNVSVKGTNQGTEVKLFTGDNN
jgi:hypothetical protein